MEPAAERPDDPRPHLQRGHVVLAAMEPAKDQPDDRTQHPAHRLLRHAAMEPAEDRGVIAATAMDPADPLPDGP
jgi:hypothetical protein